MNFKQFSLVSLMGALLIFSVVPLINYRSDMTRILHHDYTHVYQGVNPNKLFLKSVYLLDNLEKYDTLVYGSSRGGFIDVSLISDKAYNMSHGFGTLATYRDHLETMLENGMKLKEVWIGINDFDIWKDQTGKKGLVHMAYHNGLFGNTLLYTDWLFSTRDKNIKIAKGEIPLVETPYITNPKSHVDKARIDAKRLPVNRYIPPTTLGYTGIFRIDKAIEDLKIIKNLCDRHHIKLIPFFYPTYYKTYLRYNQEKIEAFKRKIVTVTDFYDFYDIGDVSIDQKNWLEGSHFHPSEGDAIIRSIQKGEHLVTAKSIDARIQETRATIKNIPNLVLLPKGAGAYHYNPHIDFSLFPTVFDIKDKTTHYSKNNQFTLTPKGNDLQVNVTHNDPVLVIEPIETKSKYVALTGEITVPKDIILQLFFKEKKTDKYSEKLHYNYTLKKGENSFRIFILSKYLHSGLRIDFTNKTGEYLIKKLEIKSLETY